LDERSFSTSSLIFYFTNSKIMKFSVFILTILLVFMFDSTHAQEGSDNARDIAIAKKRARVKSQECVKWGNQFAVPLDGNNLRLDCKSPAGRPVCCVAMAEDEKQFRGVGYGIEDLKDGINSIENKVKEVCTITKEYFSSPQELREFQVAKRISKMGATELQAFKDGGEKEEVDSGTRLPLHVHEQRKLALLNYVTSPESVANATKWLNRVSLHMASDSVPEETADDGEFLSRFLVTKTCNGEIKDQWNEWIEPLNVVARHPFGFGTCRPAGTTYAQTNAPRKPRSDVDYVLLQSGRQLAKQENSKLSKGNKQSRKHYMFDAGTSTFDSSLYWFTCAYSQRKVAFDDVYGWEMTILNPQEYWEKVPPKWLPHWHFFNTPISSDHSSAHSPVRIIKSIASETDFVAFKLDIDHPDTEMPVAIDMLKDTKFSNLIDEFFFELHFRCEIMTSCGWGKQVPYESKEGLKLERADVLDYFLKIRQMGVRAHIWP
jgi:hypothetical protein